MPTQTLSKKIKYLEKRIDRIESALPIPSTPLKNQPRNSGEGLKLLAGLWSKKPRTKRELTAVRKRLWNE